MTGLNNLDVVILIVLAISAIIALSRGFVKEVLSIVGWILSGFAVIWLLPVFTPLTKQYIDSGLVAGIVSALFILILFMVIWILLTDNLIGKIRSSKLNGLDRFLGLFFGIMRAFLLIILINILINWVMPHDKQPEVLQKSKYFNIAGDFAKPIENLIPQETLDIIKKKTTEMTQDKNKDDKKAEEKKAKEMEADALFERLAQPKVENKSTQKASSASKTKTKTGIKEEFSGYNQNERENLERLINMVE